MTRYVLTKYIFEKYGAESEYPWKEFSDYAVFRHSTNKKWFALIMNVTKDKFGLKSTEPVDVVNLKCDRVMIGTFDENSGIYPAYHMNKGSWISVFLDGSCDDDNVKFLLENSFTLTDEKKKKPKKTD